MFSFITAFNPHLASTCVLERLNATLMFIYNLMTSKGNEEKPPDDIDVMGDASGLSKAISPFAENSSLVMQSVRVCFTS